MRESRRALAAVLTGLGGLALFYVGSVEMAYQVDGSVAPGPTPMLASISGVGFALLGFAGLVRSESAAIRRPALLFGFAFGLGGLAILLTGVVYNPWLQGGAGPFVAVEVFVLALGAALIAVASLLLRRPIDDGPVRAVAVDVPPP
jgi:hypothetical protein